MALVYVRSGASGANNGTSKTDAYTTLAAAFAGGAAGDTFYVASDHSEASGSALTLTPPGTAANPVSVICVNFAGSTPPVAADITTGASITTAGTFNLTFAGGYAYWQGVNFSVGVGSSSLVAMQLLSADGAYVMKNLTLSVASTNGSSNIQLGNVGSNSNSVIWENVKASFAAVGQSLRPQNVRFTWRSTATAIQGTVPTSLFTTSSRNGTVIVQGVDLSALGSGKNLVGSLVDPNNFYFIDCKLDAAVTPALTPASFGASEITLSRCDSGATNYVNSKYAYAGTQTTTTEVVRTGGSSNGSTLFAAKLVSTANAKFTMPFEGLPCAANNAAVGSSVTVTLHGVSNSAAMPTNEEVWVDVSCLGSSGSPLGIVTSGAKATVLTAAANLTATTEAWDSGASARQNSQAYTVGQVYKVASNSGRVFFCTTAGTSAGSEPAGLASAIDGGSVTDGTAVFRAGWRFRQAISVTPQVAGAVLVYPRVGGASKTVYLDQKPELA